MEGIEEKASRSRFLRQLGVAVGVAVGAAALPGTGRATTDVPVCCEVSCKACEFPAKSYRCSCPGFSYCACFTNQPECFTAPC
jgi:hypothetical protein